MQGRSSPNSAFIFPTVRGPLRFHDRVSLWGFRLPTSENIYVLQDNDDLTMIDAGHGIYYVKPAKSTDHPLGSPQFPEKKHF